MKIKQPRQKKSVLYKRVLRFVHFQKPFSRVYYRKTYQREVYHDKDESSDL